MNGHPHDPQGYAQRRATLEASRQAHMLLVRRAVAAGYPAPELSVDEDGFGNAVRQLLLLCRTPGVDAPMVLDVAT